MSLSYDENKSFVGEIFGVIIAKMILFDINDSPIVFMMKLLFSFRICIRHDYYGKITYKILFVLSQSTSTGKLPVIFLLR